MPVPESQYVCCMDCKRGPKFKEHGADACSAGWRARTRKSGGCYCGERIPGTKSKGRYWDKPWSLVDGCTPCSPGCDHCWSMAMAKRFHKWPEKVTAREDRLYIPLHTRKPTTFAIWNDLYHPDVPDRFIELAYRVMGDSKRHTFLVLTKRSERMAKVEQITGLDTRLLANIWHGLTVCNQDEADAKIPELLKVPGKKFLSIEPMLSGIDLDPFLRCPTCGYTSYDVSFNMDHGLCKGPGPGIHAVILGGETGPGARPMHPDWVRSVRDQCAAAGVPFYFKQWGEWAHDDEAAAYLKNKCVWMAKDGRFECADKNETEIWDENDSCLMVRVGSKRAGRLLDGREWNELPWRQDA